jgi:hypothetical protein
MEKNNKKYNIVDEYGRLIESNASLKRAQSTKRLNPGSKIKNVKEIWALITQIEKEG